MLRARVDRHRCIGAGNCITLAPTAFGWVAGDLFKVDLIDPDSVEEELLRVAALSCPTAAIEIEEVDELLPWQLRGKTGPPRRVQKTFLFTDIVGSTTLVGAIGDDAWTNLVRWHDETLRGLFAAHQGKEIDATGDGFFVGFDSPDTAIACAVAIQRKLADHRRQHGFAPQVRIGVHVSEADQVGEKYRGMGVHEAARIGSLAQEGQILASTNTAAGQTTYPVSEPRTVELKGVAERIEVVSVDWR
jgi:class 3 adenylate cyclase